MKQSTVYIIALIMFVVASIWTASLAVIVYKYNIPVPSAPVFMLGIPPTLLYIGTFIALLHAGTEY